MNLKTWLSGNHLLGIIIGVVLAELFNRRR